MNEFSTPCSKELLRRSLIASALSSRPEQTSSNIGDISYSIEDLIGKVPSANMISDTDIQEESYLLSILCETPEGS